MPQRYEQIPHSNCSLKAGEFGFLINFVYCKMNPAMGKIVEQTGFSCLGSGTGQRGRKTVFETHVVLFKRICGTLVNYSSLSKMYGWSL